ncbi:UNVERIFIED_CONTAM: hypothetical protein NCL1_34742 [Trichonephila clavipes]
MRNTSVIDVDDVPKIQRNVARLLNSIPKEDFLQSFQEGLFKRRSAENIIITLTFLVENDVVKKYRSTSIPY